MARSCSYKSLIRVSAFIMLAGCSATHRPGDPVPEIIPEKPLVAAGLNSTVSPFGLEVLDEVNDGAVLHLLVRVSAKADWNSRDVIVRLTSLKNGEQSGVSFFRLGDEGLNSNQSARLSKGDARKFAISVPSTEMTDYQLELLWGKDAELALQASIKPRGAGSAVLTDINVESQDCAPPCNVSYEITANIENQSPRILRRATLGVGYNWVGASEQQADTIPESEESVELKNLNLAPGGRREVKLRLAQGVPRTQDGAYKPSLRILNFDFQD